VAAEQRLRDREPEGSTGDGMGDSAAIMPHPQVLLHVQHGGDRGVVRDGECGGDARHRQPVARPVGETADPVAHHPAGLHDRRLPPE